MNLIYDPFQCISTIAFVKNEGEVLDSPIWIMLINIVALEMLGAKMPKPTGLYWYLDPTYYSQTDVESLVVVAADVTQPLASGRVSSSHHSCQMKIIIMMPLIITFVIPTASHKACC